MTQDELTTALIQQISRSLSLTIRQVSGAVKLLDEGNTIPFITRYRQEATGGLDETQLREILKLLQELRNVVAEREKILKAIQAQGKLTPELQQAIEQADSMKRLEELYAPYRSKRKTRADEAREMGLDPVAKAVWSGRIGDANLNQVAAACVGKHPALTSVDIVLQGVQDLVAARISEEVELRDLARKTAIKTCTISSKLNAKSEEAATFQDYATFEQPTSKIPPHRILALNRGEDRNALKISMKWDQALGQARIASALNLARHSARQFMEQCITDALKRLIGPAIEREIRRDLTQQAHAHALTNFGRNVRQLLLQPPLLGRTILAIDPGFRTGCKLAVLSAQGDVLTNDVIYITDAKTQPQAAAKLTSLVQKYNVEVLAIGNGTASRETQELVSATIAENNLPCRYVVVNEAGASIYSASEVGREEFPQFEATVRGTISIGRRLQDPLSELVKIEPQHIGVGMYQHDLPEKELNASLADVVESCVNHVGVELNNASAELLKYVSGLNKNTAKAIVAWRESNGAFPTRDTLKQIPGVGQKTYEQAVGFLRIRGGDEPLDATWVHPESYPLARKILKKAGITPAALSGGASTKGPALAALQGDSEKMPAELNSDRYTIEQVLSALLKPGRDPREDLSPPLMRANVLSLDELQIGTELTGEVTNVVDFGAFVDVGLKNDGLIHISKMANHFISSPQDVVSVGQTVRVWVDSVDTGRGRIGLTMLKPA
ncbi:Tex-like N-terminal domain-containing protein [Planctomicrobium sp. SH527]|uniref:Tex-like N-terminal domain-containing protein n=1 Tax=Planctomicrobium sp. SH527 TaxID=3448123 RepID=UPI003F5BA9ED